MALPGHLPWPVNNLRARPAPPPRVPLGLPFRRGLVRRERLHRRPQPGRSTASRAQPPRRDRLVRSVLGVLAALLRRVRYRDPRARSLDNRPVWVPDPCHPRGRHGRWALEVLPRPAARRARWAMDPVREVPADLIPVPPTVPRWEGEARVDLPEQPMRGADLQVVPAWAIDPLTGAVAPWDVAPVAQVGPAVGPVVLRRAAAWAAVDLLMAAAVRWARWAGAPGAAAGHLQAACLLAVAGRAVAREAVATAARTEAGVRVSLATENARIGCGVPSIESLGWPRWSWNASPSRYRNTSPWPSWPAGWRFPPTTSSRR